MTERQAAPVSDEGNGNGQEHEPDLIPKIWPKAKEVVKELDVYSCRHLYFIANGDGSYVECTLPELKRDFGQRDIDPIRFNDLLWVIDHQRAVDYAGPLSGRRAGLHSFKTRKLLCTKGPTIIEGRKGKCPTIAAILKALFGGKEQLRYVIGWLSVARQAMITETFSPGQALIMAGPINTGKSFTQKYIFTPMLGGRDARPFLFMSGQTSFNSELFEAEHWIFDDEAAADDIHMRNQIAAMIRQIASSDDGHCHAKGLKGLTLPLFGRLSISCNDDEKGLLALPPLNIELATKVILLKAYVGDFRWPTNPAERRALIDLVETEYPSFAYELDRYVIRPELQHQRYGIKAHQDEEMTRKAAGVGQDHDLLELARESVSSLPQEKTAKEWFDQIFADQAMQEGLRRITASHMGLGRIFKRLCEAKTPGIYVRESDGKRLYEVRES